MRLLRSVLLIGLAAFALLLLGRDRADASGSSGGCVPTDSYVPMFCLNVPTTTARRDTTVPLLGFDTGRAELHVEAVVGGIATMGFAQTVERAVERVEVRFGRSFDPRPRVFVFASAPSFAAGARDLFGYSEETASHVANTYGGIFDRPTLTIALNWGAASSARMAAAVEHELTHLMIRELTGSGSIPAWLDEGIATMVEADAPEGAIWSAELQLLGRATARSGVVRLDQVQTVADFHAAYARLGQPLYAYAASMTLALSQQVGWDGVLRMLAAVGQGSQFTDAYRREAGQDLSALEARAIDQPATGIVVGDAVSTRGDRLWSVATGRSAADVEVVITGPNEYRLSFVVRTDAFGMYRGSFGSTAAPGRYEITVSGARATLVVAH